MKLIDFSHAELSKKLQVYLEQDSTYHAVYDHTKQQFEANAHLTAHNWEHTYRDIINAVVIGEAEAANMRIVLPAITMHDIGFFYGAVGKTHGAVGAEQLETYLQGAGIAYEQSELQQIAKCIRTHKGSMHNEKPESLEAKVVADADLLEKFGPFGVYNGGIRTYTEYNYSFDQVLERGAQLAELTMETATGKRLAEPGRQFVAQFFNELREAAEPYL